MPLDSRLISAAGLLISILVLIFFLQIEDQSLALFVGVIICCLVFIATLWGTFGANTVLHSPVSGLKWKRTAFLGITLQQTLIPRGEPLSINLSYSQSLHLPPSVLEFSESALKEWTLSHATAVFRAALIGLFAHRVIQIHEHPKYVARWKGDFKRNQNVYLLTADEEQSLVFINGALERQIVLVLRSWVKRSGREVLEWPDGAPVYEVVRAVFKKDVSSPADWVFDLVAREAVAQGWGRLKGWPWKRFQPNPALDEQLQTELATIDELSSQLAQQQPDLSRVLNDQIERAIRSRKYQQHYEP